MLRSACLIGVLALGLVVAACAAPPPVASPTALTATLAPATTASTALPTATSGGSLPSCQLTPVVAPTMAPDPGYTQLDPTTNLHITGHAQALDLATYRLGVTGLVDRPLSLSYDDLRCLPKVTATPTLVCPGFFVDQATWSGVPFKALLDLAGVQAGATLLTLRGADGYEAHVELTDALKEENFLAYEWEGQPLPVLHGFPLRAIFPALQGSQWVKWLLEIQVE